MVPKLHRNKPATKIDMEALQKRMEDCPDSYQHKRAAHFGVSSSCILYALRRLGISIRPLREITKQLKLRL